jgi:hypothetical protein
VGGGHLTLRSGRSPRLEGPHPEVLDAMRRASRDLPPPGMGGHLSVAKLIYGGPPASYRGLAQARVQTLWLIASSPR